MAHHVAAISFGLLKSYAVSITLYRMIVNQKGAQVTKNKTGLFEAQIKLVSHKHFEGVMDKNDTVKSMSVANAREVLTMLGYKKIREENDNGCIIEIWELPERLQTK